MTIITEQIMHKHPTHPDSLWHDQHNDRYLTLYTPDGNSLCESINTTRVQTRLLQLAARIGRTHSVLAESSFQSNVISLTTGRTQRVESQQRLFFDIRAHRVLIDELHPQWRFTELSKHGVGTVKHCDLISEDVFFVRPETEPRMPWNRQSATLTWRRVKEVLGLEPSDWMQFAQFIAEQSVANASATLVLTQADCTDWGHKGKEHPELGLEGYTGQERPGNQTVAETIVRLFTIAPPRYSTRAVTKKFDTRANIVWLPPKREFNWDLMGDCQGPRVIFYPSHQKFANSVFCGGTTPEKVFLILKPLPSVLELYKECPEFEVQFQSLYFNTLLKLLQNVNSISGPEELKSLLTTVLTNPAS